MQPILERVKNNQCSLQFLKQAGFERSYVQHRAGYIVTDEFFPNTKPCYEPEQTRPFIFILRDNANNSIQFIGKLGQLRGDPVTPTSEVSIYDDCP